MRAFLFLNIVLVAILSIHRSIAQNCPAALPSAAWVRGNFNAPLQSCANQAIAVANTGNVVNPKYVYDYKTLSDTATATTQTAFTYKAAGTYAIVQVGTLNGKRAFACSVIRIVDNPKPTFTLTTCSNATVRLTLNTTGLAYNGYTINWGDGSNNQTIVAGQASPTHTYPSNNTYNIVVTGIYVGASCTGISDVVSVTPIGIAPQLPKISKIEVIDNTTVDLTYTGIQAGINYQLQQRTLPLPIFTTQNSATKTTSGADTKYRIAGLNNTANVYGFVVSVGTTCGTTTNSISTPETYSMSLQTVATPNYQNNLTWRPVAGGTQPKQFVIYRDMAQLAIVAANQTTYSDTKAVCGKKHSYQVVAEYAGSPLYTSSSIVRDATTQPAAAPPLLTEILANVKDDKTALIYVVAPPVGTKINSYILERGDGVTQSSIKTSFTDSLANPGTASICYKIGYTDACNRTSEATKTACTIYLEQKGESLRWTPEAPFLSKIQSYTVERLDAQGRVRKNYAVASNTTDWLMDANDTDQDVIYRIRATSTTKISGVSNVVSYFRPMKLFLPSSFTPNGDNINEVFEVKGLFIKEAKLSIFARTGQLIFQTDDWKKGWNGINADGQSLESDTYVYTIEATDLKGNHDVVRGTVQLLR